MPSEITDMEMETTDKEIKTTDREIDTTDMFILFGRSAIALFVHFLSTSRFFLPDVYEQLFLFVCLFF